MGVSNEPVVIFKNKQVTKQRRSTGYITADDRPIRLLDESIQTRSLSLDIGDGREVAVYKSLIAMQRSVNQNTVNGHHQSSLTVVQPAGSLKKLTVYPYRTW